MNIISLDVVKMDRPGGKKSRGRVALFNDTGRAPHVGCKGVSLAHDTMLDRLGFEVAVRGYLGEYRELWQGDRENSRKAFWKTILPEQFSGLDAVIVNGEGTIHHGAGLHLLTILAGAQELGIPTFLVNAVFQECEQDLETLRKLTDFTVRDAASSAYLDTLGIPHRIVLDSILEAEFNPLPIHDYAGKIIVTDWHFARNDDVGQGLQAVLREFGPDAVFYPLESSERNVDWHHAVADFAQARLVVTGRHHGVCLAGLAGVPFVALGSNTWKVEGMLKLLPGNLRTCTDISQLSAHCQEAIADSPKFFEIQKFLHAQRPLTTFEKLAVLPAKAPQVMPNPGIPGQASSQANTPSVNIHMPSNPIRDDRKLCVATNYLLMTEANRQMWTALDEQLEANGSRLVLLTSALPTEPLPFAVVPIPFLIRDYVHYFPLATEETAVITKADMRLAQLDAVRADCTFAPGDALRGLLACRKFIAEVLEKLQPGYVLTWDSSSPLAIMLSAQARALGIPVQAFERGLLPETMMVDSMGLQAWSDMRMNWQSRLARRGAVDEKAYEATRQYYLRTKPKKYDQPDFGDGGKSLRETLGIGRKKVVVFFGGGFEAAQTMPRSTNHQRHHLPAFTSTNDALLSLWRILENDPDTTLIFKPHPLDHDPYAVAKIEGVKIVTDVNVHALMDLADVVAVQFTTLQFEVALYEKPVLLLGRSAWWGRNATYEVDRPEDLRAVLKEALSRKDWRTRQANAHAFINQMMEQYLIGIRPEVPTQRHLNDFAQFIVETSLDARDLAPIDVRWENLQGAILQMRPPGAGPLLTFIPPPPPAAPAPQPVPALTVVQ